MNYEVTCQTTPSRAADDRFSGEVVECEWEAAEALAFLSHPVARNGTGAGEIELCVKAAHIREQGIARKSENEQEITIQSEYESELKTSLVLDLNYPPVTSRKSRQELTEAEKEERRMRRVLANRESAKRTVRRRQAMQEELKRKAADLALENEKLKKNKELAAAEYNSLKDKNNNLRMQIAKIVKAEVEETESTPVGTPTSTTSPTFLHNQSPKEPLVLPTVFPSFDGVVLQSGLRSISGITPEMPTSLGGFKPSDKLESSVMMNTPGTPLCIVSFPWQMQFHAQSYPFHPWPSYPNEQHNTSLVYECSTSTSITAVNMENHLKATPLKVETKTPDSDRDHQKADRDFLPDESASKGLVQVTSTSSPFVLPVLARQNQISQQNTPDVKVTYSAVGRVAGATTETHQERVTCSNINASADAILATGARKKWKALMK